MLDQVVGHAPAIAMLRSHVAEPHASYIFYGPSGVGKRYTAIQYFLELNCTGTKQPGCTCKTCAQVADNSHPDLRVMAPDGQSYGIAQVQEMADDALLYPRSANYKVYVLEDAHLLTTNAANCLLKVLEDAPPRSRFIFVLEDEHELLDTIRSRSVRVKFVQLPNETVVSFLLRYDDDQQKAQLCANLSGGSVGTALDYLRGGRLTTRERAVSLLMEFHRKPVHQILDAVEREENASSLFFLLRHLFTDMALLGEPGLEGRAANFDKVEVLKKVRERIGDAAVVFGVQELNRLYLRVPYIKATFPNHLKNSLLQIRRRVRAEAAR